MARTETHVAPEFNVKEYARINDYQGHENEAEAIADLYRKTYEVTAKDMLRQLSYPYPEVFDAEWIHMTATDRNTIWKVVRDSLTDRVIGSGTCQLNPESQRAYVRGVMIDPDYQGYGLAGYILVNAFREVINTYRDVVKLFWCESRTAHSGSQKISEASGMRPVGLLPNKDIFLEKRESDLLYVLYAMNTLKTRRTDIQLIPEVIPIYEAVGRQFRLEVPEPARVASVQGNGYDVKGSITMDKYHYCYCTFRAHSKELKFMVNPRVQVAEKMWFTPDIDPVTLKTLLQFSSLALNPTLYYMECYVSAYQPEIQRVFIDLGYKPTGYIPGWTFVDGKREDMVIMSWVRELPPLRSMQLTPRATKIAQIFLS